MSIFTRDGEFRNKIPLFRNGKYIGRCTPDHLQRILESGGYIHTDHTEERFTILLHDRRRWGFQKHGDVPRPEDIDEIHITYYEIYPNIIAGLEVSPTYY